MSVEQANIIADKITLLNKEYNSRLVSNDLQILRPYLQSMETMAVLRTINKESQPFAFAMTLGSIGIFKSESDLGIIGPAIEKIIQTIAKGIDTIQPNHPIGDKKVLMNGTLFVIAGLMVLAAMGATEGTANSLYDEEAQKEINTFSLELLLLMGLYSNTPEYIFETLAEITNFPKSKEITAALTLISLLLTIWTIHKEKGPDLETILTDSKPKIAEYTKTIETAIENYSEKNGTAQSNAMLIWIKQARFALETNDISKLIETINDVLKICDVTPEELDEDIQDICKQTKMILGLLRHGGDEDLNTVTGIWQTG